MKLNRPTAALWTGSDDHSPSANLTHLAVGAHPDDVELMAHHGIDACFGRKDRAFGAVVMTDGASSPRGGVYSDLGGEEMREIRRQEQKAASTVGRYALTVMLDYHSSLLKEPSETGPDEDLLAIFRETRPEVIYTHNPADKHPTHVAVVARVLRVLREMKKAERPRELLGCEAWRDLDWIPDDSKRVLDSSGREHLAAALLGCFDSQIQGGKRYDLAVMGRRRANATFLHSHSVDELSMATVAVDLSPLMHDPSVSLEGFVRGLVQDLADEIGQELSPWR
ncbi:MAG: PIG-L deacetylase family protein [Myxococcota bacterium]